MAARHPAQDVLADLAAEVLDEHQARVIEAHVIGCARCADLLADAERVRQLLLSGDPGPMPDHVWHRIAGALSAEATGTPAPPATAAAEASAPESPNWITQEWPVGADWVPEPDPQQPVDAPTGQWERFVDNSFDVEDRPADADRPIAAPVRVDGSEARGGTGPFDRGSQRPRRRSASLRSRRDVRTESQSPALVRLAKPLSIAAGIIALAGLAGLAVVRLPLGDEATDATSAGAAADRATPADGAFAAMFLATDTDYTKADIEQKAMRLVRDSGAGPGAEAGAARTPAAAPSALATPAGTAAGTAASGGPSASGAASAKAPQVAVPAPAGSGLARPQTGPSNALLADPKRLAECLAELKAPDQNPILVDLAHYQGKEAAIIVLAGRDGGYEIWAVPRSCGTGDTLPFGYTAVPPS